MAFDMTAVTAIFTDAGTAAATVGAASLILVIGIAAWKKLRGAA